MKRMVAAGLILSAATVWGGQTAVDPDELLDRVKSRMKQNLTRQPDYVCVQTVERLSRSTPDAKLEPVDTLRLEVGLIGDRELFSWKGGRRFEEKELADLVGRGTIGNGNFALHSRNVFVSDAPEFTYAGEETLHGRRMFKYEFDVPVGRSTYRIRVPPREAVVGFDGAFWADAETLDLVRLEVNPYNIPEPLGLARASDAMEYARVPIGAADFLLPKSSELSMVSLHGEEHRNRTDFSSCRQYVGEATLSFEGHSSDKPAAAESAMVDLPPRLTLELMLDSDVDLETAAIGDLVGAVLASPLKDGDRIVAPKGAPVRGRLVRLEKYTLPLPHYVIALQFSILEMDGAEARFTATMETAGPASGLIKQAKTMNPTFNRRRSPRLDILVNEQQQGQGILHWDARQSRIKRGLKMRWLTELPQ